MAFEDRDVSSTPTVSRTESVEEITFRRNRSLSGVQLEILVTRMVDVDGERQRVTQRVPAETVDSVWPGNQRTLKAWLLAIIDAAAV